MLEMIRSLQTNLRYFVRRMRQSERHPPRLRFSLSMLDLHARDNGDRLPVVLSGHTRNISETGLALIVPPIRQGVDILAATNRKLLIVLELPSGSIRLQAMPVRYERTSLRDAENGYLLGVRIISMSKDDRVRFLRYIHRLTRGVQISQRRTING